MTFYVFWVADHVFLNTVPESGTTFLSISCSSPLALTLTQPASKWMHRATLRRHSCPSRAATSASSQVSVIFRRSFLTVPIQLAFGRPGPLLKPGTSQYSACCGIRRWSICRTWPSQRSLLSLSMFSMLCCPVLGTNGDGKKLSWQPIHLEKISYTVCWYMCLGNPEN